VEAFTVAALGVDQSHGRLPDGNTTLRVFNNPTPGSANGIPGDLNYDMVVNMLDLTTLISDWGSTSLPVSDINRDGAVNMLDLTLLIGNWG